MNDTLQKALVNINQLQHQIDSLRNTQLMDQLRYRVIEHDEVVNNVNDFYLTAWAILAGALTIIGIGVPAYINWIQKKDLENIKKQTIAEVNKVFEQNQTKFHEEYINILKKIEEKFKEKDNQLEFENRKTRIISEANTLLYFGKDMIEKSKYTKAITTLTDCFHMYHSIKLYDRALSPLEKVLKILKQQNDLKEINLCFLYTIKKGNLWAFIEYLEKQKIELYKNSLASLKEEFARLNN